MSMKPVAIGVCICMTFLLISCSIVEPEQKVKMMEPSKYQVNKLAEPMAIDANWDKAQWQKTKPIDIKLFMGEKPSHLPKVQAKALYDGEHIYIIFRAEDRYVRSVATEYHGAVWEDSCVEFFFTPGGDISEGYFNLEVNCGGTILCSHRTSREENVKMLETNDCARIEIAHSLPKVVDPEITEPVTWTLEYRVPIEMLEKYTQVTRPAPGVTWGANFFKCGDKTSHPHWLTWSYIANETPDFHRPEYFGTLEFVD